jgi:glycerol-3-phosphate acyltransferase PlsY
MRFAAGPERAGPRRRPEKRPQPGNRVVIDPISWEYSWPYVLAAFAGGYVFGSVPFGLLLTRLAGLGDVRKIGSGNIGATNVLRTGRKGLAALTLLFDAGKGAAAVLIAAMFGPDTMIVAGYGALIGHLFPVWLRFKGGKGVATALGIMLGISWPTALVCLAVWIAVAAITRYSSLAALVATFIVPFVAWWLATPQIAEFGAALAAIIWLRHLANIRRLLRGDETRIGDKTPSSSTG